MHSRGQLCRLFNGRWIGFYRTKIGKLHESINLLLCAHTFARFFIRVDFPRSITLPQSHSFGRSPLAQNPNVINIHDVPRVWWTEEEEEKQNSIDGAIRGSICEWKWNARFAGSRAMTTLNTHGKKTTITNKMAILLLFICRRIDSTLFVCLRMKTANGNWKNGCIVSVKSTNRFDDSIENRYIFNSFNCTSFCLGKFWLQSAEMPVSNWLQCRIYDENACLYQGRKHRLRTKNF